MKIHIFRYPNSLKLIILSINCKKPLYIYIHTHTYVYILCRIARNKNAFNQN